MKMEMTACIKRMGNLAMGNRKFDSKKDTRMLTFSEQGQTIPFEIISRHAACRVSTKKPSLSSGRAMKPTQMFSLRERSIYFSRKVLIDSTVCKSERAEDKERD